MISKEIEFCVQDMRNAVCTGKISLEAQVRAYDLLDRLMSLPEGVSELLPSGQEFCQTYESLADSLEDAYNEQSLLDEAKMLASGYEELLRQSEQRAKSAEELHNAARETFDIWQTCGYFSRRKALRSLRAKAGFRLESNRIGNYVAKTFDLMNEARMTYAGAQQALFAANVSYKVKAGIYADIYRYMQGKKV
jgi:hypothetical protein